jgi:cytochrome c oxidase assembly protein subunit 11
MPDNAAMAHTLADPSSATPERSPQSPQSPHASPHRRLILRLLLIVAIAFAFGFALVPLYDVFCQATGFNGKTSDIRFVKGGLSPGDATLPGKDPLNLQNSAGNATLTASVGAPAPKVDTARLVTIEFTGTVMPGLPWDVRPLTTTLDLHPGELQTARFLVSNRSAETVTGHAVPSVTPGQAAQHFAKVDCFCFTQQTLLPGEAREMAVAFIVKPELAADVRTITLAYAFFRPPASASATAAPSSARGLP